MFWQFHLRKNLYVSPDLVVNRRSRKWPHARRPLQSRVAVPDCTSLDLATEYGFTAREEQNSPDPKAEDENNAGKESISKPVAAASGFQTFVLPLQRCNMKRKEPITASFLAFKTRIPSDTTHVTRPLLIHRFWLPLEGIQHSSAPDLQRIQTTTPLPDSLAATILTFLLVDTSYLTFLFRIAYLNLRAERSRLCSSP